MSPTLTPPQATGMSVSSITRSSATITWTTNKPATSEIELTTDAGQPVRLARDASLVTSHRQVLNGLAAGATYRYRVRSGGVRISADESFATAPEGSGPEITGVDARRVTGTTALLGWTTTSGNVAQVEYGPTLSYSGFTLLKIYSGPNQKLMLTGLEPGAIYHYRIKAWDGAGFLGASGDYTFATAPVGLATLLGDQAVQNERVVLAAGQAAVYQLTAAQSGLASVVHLYADAGSTAGLVRVGLYSDQAGAPGAILAQGSATVATSSWTSITIPPLSIVQGQRYWVAVLSPTGAGSLVLRDLADGANSLLSRQTTLAAFPVTWPAGIPAGRSALSVSVEQAPPAVTLIGPDEGAIVTGSVALSAEVDDDAPITRVQFFVDGKPIGAALSAPPFTTRWDSAAFSARQPHTITAVASDVGGRVGVSGAVDVQVDNGPTISAVAVSPGLTASSARVDWVTDVLADAQVEFGPTASYGSKTPIDGRAAWSHEMQLTGLVPSATYHYRVRSRDANAAVAVSEDATFSTPAP